MTYGRRARGAEGWGPMWFAFLSQGSKAGDFPY